MISHRLLIFLLLVLATCLYLGYYLEYDDDAIAFSNKSKIFPTIPQILSEKTKLHENTAHFPKLIDGKPNFYEIRSFENLSIPFQSKMVCQSFHEEKGISFEQLWTWPSVRAFIGIWSVADKFELRYIIRELYLRQQQNLTDDKVDFKFFIGIPPIKLYTTELKSRLMAENNTYGDIVMLDVIENMDEGKAYYYWKWVGDHFDTSKYDYVAKTDDDVFIHFQNLALNLRPLPRDYLYYGFNSNNEFIVGMLEVLSIDQAQRIASSPYNRDEWMGPEDVMLGRWMTRNFDQHLFIIGEFCLIFNDPRVLTTYLPFLWKPWASPQSIAIHWLKTIHAWKGVVDTYFSE